MEAAVTDESVREEDKPFKPRKKRKPVDYSAFECEAIEHALSEEDRVCETYNSTLEEMSMEARYMIKLVPAHFVFEEHRRHAYVCKTYSKTNVTDGDTPVSIKRAAMP